MRTAFLFVVYLLLTIITAPLWVPILLVLIAWEFATGGDP